MARARENHAADLAAARREWEHRARVARANATGAEAAVSVSGAVPVAVFGAVPVTVPVAVAVASQRGGRGIPGSADAAARSWNAARSRCSAAEARRSADSARADACSS